MKISTGNKRKDAKFIDVSFGDVFTWEGQVFVKAFIPGYADNVNAIDMEDGAGALFADEDFVTPQPNAVLHGVDL